MSSISLPIHNRPVCDFLFVGKWNLQKLRGISDFTYQNSVGLKDAWNFFQTNSAKVIMIPLTSAYEKKFSDLYQFVSQQYPFIQWILLAPFGLPVLQIFELQNQFNFFKILNGPEDQMLHQTMLDALTKSQEEKQYFELSKLYNEVNSQLEKVHTELETRIEKRTLELNENRHRLMQSGRRLEALRRLVLNLSACDAIENIERELNEVLNPILGTSWVKVTPVIESDLFAEQVRSDFLIKKQELFLQNQIWGYLFFLRAMGTKIAREDYSIMQSVGEVLEIFLHRLENLKSLNNLKTEWSQTFSSMQTPVALITSDYTVVQANRENFNSKNQLEYLHSESFKTSNEKCYKRFFALDQPCNACQLGRSFQIQSPQGNGYEVISQNLSAPNVSPLFLNMYYDLTALELMQARIAESSKQAELGMVSSSIAHELNNPLSGILSFSQILITEVPKNDPIYPDIFLIEKTAQRCREIVQNLLGFARKTKKSDEISNLYELILTGVKIIELKTRPLGIQIEIDERLQSAAWKIQSGKLGQVFLYVLQICLYCLEHQSQQKSESKLNSKKIKIIFEPQNTQCNLIFYHSGLPWSDIPEFLMRGIFFQTQILTEVGGRLDLSTNSSPENWAKISLPRPVLQP